MENNTNNVNTANFELKLESIEFKGVTLKGLTVSGRADFSDEKVRMETEGAVTLMKALFAFADSKLDRLIDHAIETNTKRVELRQKEFDRENELLKARVAAKKAECEYWKAAAQEALKEEEKDDTEE